MIPMHKIAQYTEAAIFSAERRLERAVASMRWAFPPEHPDAGKQIVAIHITAVEVTIAAA